MTPLGVGVYLSSPKNSSSLIVASSERAVQDLAAAASNGSSLDNSMARSLKDKLNGAATTGTVYCNFLQFAKLLDSIKSTVSSMTGPNPDLDRAFDTSSLKKLGVGIGSLSYTDGVVKIQSVVELAEVH